MIDRYTRKKEISDHCPFNAMIECRDHAGNPIPALPDRCNRCGWNPAEAQRRKALLDIKKGVTEDA